MNRVSSRDRDKHSASLKSPKFHSGECCICLEVLDQLSKSIQYMERGHTLHTNCYKNLLQQPASPVLRVAPLAALLTMADIVAAKTSLNY